MKISDMFKKKQTSFDATAIREALNNAKSFHFPNGIKGQISVDTSGRKCVIELPFESSHILTELHEILAPVLMPEQIEFNYAPPRSQHNAIKNCHLVVAVSSGKGGVGKSTVTANLAVALAKLGHKVGVLDADIYGPSMPMMFGSQGHQIASLDGKTMEPLQTHGVAINSIGYVVPEDKATIWRGPMASRALMQVANETNWPELDILLVDMPPGTGDIQLTMSESIKSDAAIVVTTPQNIALADAEKGINMFNKTNIPVLGIVENMSLFVCDECGKTHELFGHKGGANCAEQHQLPLLAQLPLIQEVREGGDCGQPYALKANNEYEVLAFSLMMQLSKKITSVIALG